MHGMLVGSPRFCFSDDLLSWALVRMLLLTWLVCCLQTADILFATEGTVLLPASDSSLSGVTNVTFSDENSSSIGTDWQGCIMADHALFDGQVVLPGAANRQPSGEGCCRSCAAFAGSGGNSSSTSGGGGSNSSSVQCNAWNYCAQPSGCSHYSTDNTLIQLAQGDCESIDGGAWGRASTRRLEMPSTRSSEPRDCWLMKRVASSTSRRDSSY